MLCLAQDRFNTWGAPVLSVRGRAMFFSDPILTSAADYLTILLEETIHCGASVLPPPPPPLLKPSPTLVKLLPLALPLSQNRNLHYDFNRYFHLLSRRQKPESDYKYQVCL